MGDPLSSDRRHPVSVIAHRGARAFAPENTIEALRKAAALGADAAEIDVHLTADGEVLVTHDDDLVRCSNAQQMFPRRAPWLVSDFSMAEIQRLDAGTWYVEQVQRPPHEREKYLRLLTTEEMERYVSDAELAAFATGDVRMPTLAACLEVAAAARLTLHIELKNIPRFYPGLVDNVVDQVRRLNAAHRVVLSSFDHVQLERVWQLAPEIGTAVLSSDRLAHPAAYLAQLHARAYNPGCYGDYDTIGFGSTRGELDRSTIADLRAAGFDVNVWTENEPAHMLALIELGVTGIFTDYPNRLLELLSSAAQARPS